MTDKRDGGLSDIPVVDVDTHVMEPPDLWTSRLDGERWGADVPHLELDERRNELRWQVGAKRLTGVANWATAGWSDFPPSHPLRLEDADPAAWDPTERLAHMDTQGLDVQALYPNLLAFSMHAFLALDDELKLECVRAYNDFLVDFASKDPDRFILLTTLPFWDVEASVAEIYRCRELGHRGILFASKPYKVGMPPLADDHWTPIFEAADDLRLSISFHVGFQDTSEDDFRRFLSAGATRSAYAKESSLGMLGNAEGIAEVILSGLCHRFPHVNFVSVESGFSWLPYFVEMLDWQWLNSGAAKAYPERELPSFYFRRQVYGSFWFERETLGRLIDLYADNIMFETDFPHPTSLSPGPASYAKSPAETIAESLEGVDTAICRKVLYENAARIYHLPVAAP